MIAVPKNEKPADRAGFVKLCHLKKSWSGRRGSNPRPRPWQGRALPLSYTRIREIGGDHSPAIGRAIANAALKRQLGQGRARIGSISRHQRIPVTIIEQGGGPAPQAAPDLIKETTTQTFVKDVIEESKRQPVLIDFWAPWCGPCRQLTPVLEKSVRAAKGKVKLVKMNIDEHPAIPGQMGIQSIPAVIAFVNGQPADGFMGAVPESQVNAFIDKLTKGMAAPGEPNIAEILQEAAAMLAEGDPAAAAQIYAEVLAIDA